MMQKFVDKLTEWSEKIGQSFALKVILGGFGSIMLPATIGSLAALLYRIPIGNYQNFLTDTGCGSALDAIFQFTVGMLAVYLVFGIAYSAADKWKLKKQAASIGVIAVIDYLIVTPFEEGVIPTTWLGVSGIYSAVACGFLTAGVFRLCSRYHIAVRLPEQVPPMVAEQFTDHLPGLFTAVLFGLLRLVTSLTPSGNFHSLIYRMVGMNVKLLVGNLAGAYLLLTVCALLWYFGIHGGMIMAGIMLFVFFPLRMENLTAYQAGEVLPNIVCGQSISAGSGSLVFILTLLMIARSEKERFISKLAIFPSLFGIDEPAYFGFPMIRNRIFFVPWVILSPIVSIFGTYLLNINGLLPYASGVSVSYNLPFFITNFLVFGWKGVIWGFVFLMIDIVIAVPFMMVFDKKMMMQS